jgi:hypothetical protein
LCTAGLCPAAPNRQQSCQEPQEAPHTARSWCSAQWLTTSPPCVCGYAWSGVLAREWERAVVVCARKQPVCPWLTASRICPTPASQYRQSPAQQPFSFSPDPAPGSHLALVLYRGQAYVPSGGVALPPCCGLRCTTGSGESIAPGSGAARQPLAVSQRAPSSQRPPTKTPSAGGLVTSSGSTCFLTWFQVTVW